MKNRLRRFVPAASVALALLAAGCATSSPHDAFVKTTDFSKLRSFAFKHTLVTGFDWRDSEEFLLEERSETVLSKELADRGFDAVGAEPDFYVVAKWKKSVSGYPDPFDSVDGPHDGLMRRGDPSHRFAARLHLTVELYRSYDGEMFWRKDLPNIFDANQFTEERVTAALRRAIEDFPRRVERDPNLPDIE